MLLMFQFSRSVMSDSVTPWTAAHQASLSFTNSWSWLRLMSIQSVVSSNHLILCRPLLLLSIFPKSGSFPMSRFFTSSGQSTGVSASTWVPLMIYSGLISFRMDWLDLLVAQGTLKSLLQYYSSSVLQRSAFFRVQLSHPYMTTGETIALTRRTLLVK